jgi:phosphoribosyl 1,2-cyclic phosphodiesterase
LIDAGLSCREIERRLGLIGLTPECLDALVITHEHMDHIKGAGALARRFRLPVYINRKTLDSGIKTFGDLSMVVIVETGQSLTLKDLSVETFTKCHDAADPVGFVFSSIVGSSAFNGARIGLVTDLGRSTRLVEDRLKGCRALILEFNYDQEMLEAGPYSLELKRRIRGPDGHLSNLQAGDLLSAVADDNLSHVVLAHLSEINNLPEKARQEASRALEKSGINGANILVSSQGEPMPMIEL